VEPVRLPNQTNLIDAGSDIGMVLQSADGKILACNPAAEQLLGYRAAQLIGTTSFDALWQTIHPDDEYPARTALLSGKPCLNVTVGFYKPNGELIWLRVSSHPLFQADARTPYAVMTAFSAIGEDELTCQKTALQQLAEIEAIYATAPIGLCFIDSNMRFVRINEHLAQINGIPASEHIGRTLREILPEQAEDLEPLYQQAIASGKPILNLEFHGKNRAQPGVKRYWLVNLYPFYQNDGRVVGVNVMVQEISDRKRTEASLQASEARYRQLVELSPDAIFIQSDGKFAFVNPAALNLFGATKPDQLIGKNVIDFIHHDYRAVVKMRMQQLEQNQAVPLLQEKFLRLDGTVVEVEVAAAAFVYQGKHAVQAVVRDISDRLAALRAMAKQESQYRYIFEAVGVSIWQEDFSVVKAAIDRLKASGVEDFRQYFAQHPEFVQWAVENVKLLNVNDITVQMCEAQTKEQLLASLNQIFLPETMEVFVGELLTIAASETFFSGETVLQTLQGNRLNVLVTLTFPPPHEPYDCVLVTLVDITARKQTEAALTQSEERFRQLANAMPQMVWTTDAKGELNYVSQQWIDYTGLTLDQTRDPSYAREFMHTDDIQSTQVQWSAALAAETTFQIEMRIKRVSDDTYRWFLVRGVPIRDEQGQVVQWYGTSTDIDDRKQVEAALRQINERFRLATLAIDGIVFEWNIVSGEVYRSDGLYQLMGVRAEDAAPTREWWMQRIHPDDFARMEVGMESLETLGDRYEGEYRVRHADGRWIDVWERGCLQRDESGQIVGILGFTTDITNRKQAEITLRQSEERYRYLAESIPQLVWTANAQGVLLDLNQRWLDFTGLTFAQSQTEGWEAIVHPDDLPILSQKWAAAQQDGSRYQAEGRIRRADGVYRWHLHQAIALKDEQNQIVKWFGTATDIEDQKQLQQQRDRLLQQEQVAREKAEQANRIKDEFLAVLSHELRSPLNPILGWSKLLQTGKVNATKTAEALTTIERNAKLQAQLIEDLLDVSRILRGKLTLNVAPVNLANAIAAALETVQLAAQAKDIQIQIDLDPNVGMVAGDAARLQQIIWNLLSNAVKFTNQGGRVDVRLAEILHQEAEPQYTRSQVEPGNEIREALPPVVQDAMGNQKERSPITNYPLPITTKYAQIQVIDTGKGINPDFLPYVFDHFRQEDSAATRKFGGLGLGLAIVRQLVELHGGTVFAESQGEGTGATFTVRLPLIKQQTKNENEPERDAESMTPSSPLAGLKILVVDDDADSRDFIAFVLEQDGAEIIALPSAIEAWREFSRAKPDLLVSDIGMPEMDGYTLMRQIRNLPPEQGGNLPAIALTAYAGEADSFQAISAGFQQHISKPIEPNQLVQAVAKLAGRLRW
jgi:PAS domain S-box-containing protein